MSAQTTIEWCDSTFNPWIGCTRVSPACDHCYAARSTPARTLGVIWGPHEPRHRTGPGSWALPLRWNKTGYRQCGECAWRGEPAAAIRANGLRCPTCGARGSLEVTRRRVFTASLADVFDNAVPTDWLEDLFELIRITPNLD